MAYLFVEDFKYGIDRRRPRYAGIPGTLWDAENVHLSRGGDIERAKKFVPLYSVPGTFGLTVLGSRVTVFGSADLAASMPPAVAYQRLQAPSGASMIRTHDVKKFDGKAYVVADFADGSRHHFYNGARVAAWDGLADSAASLLRTCAALADAINVSAACRADVNGAGTGVLLTAITPGSGFSVAGSVTDQGAMAGETVSVVTHSANQAAVLAARAEAQITVTGGLFNPGICLISKISAGPVSLIGGPVDWVLSNAATANAIAVAINDRTPVHGYVASASGVTVTIEAPPGTGPNGVALTVTTAGGFAAAVTSPFAGGSAGVAAVSQVSEVIFGGPFEAADRYAITVAGVTYTTTGRAAATPTRVHVQHKRMWALAGGALRYSALNAPTDWTNSDPNIGAGAIVVSQDADGTQDLIGIEAYQGLTALFARSAIVIYQLGADPNAFDDVQTLPNSGTLAGGALQGYGSTDVFYLAGTGVRSLQARDSSNAAFVSDAGTAFDPYVQGLITTVPRAAVVNAVSVIEPKDGRYWLAIGSQILVLTNFPGTKIRGWTRYSPGFTPTAFAQTPDQVYVRDAATVYLYGGLSGDVYPGDGEAPARVRTPFLAARDDAGLKVLQGFDAGTINEWGVTILTNPNDETDTVAAGAVKGATYPGENAGILGETTHVAVDFVCAKGGPAVLSNFALHHDGRLRA